MRHPTTFFASFDATAAAPRRGHAALTLAAAESMIPFVFLHVLIDCENFENEIDMDDDSNEKEDRNIFDVFDD